MSYCTLTDIAKVEPMAQIISLTDDSNVAVDTTIVEDAVRSADALIDTYLRGHVSVLPVSPVPEIITKISVELTICNLYLRRYGASIPEGIQTRQKWAEGMLAKIQGGSIIISEEQTKEQANNSVKVATAPKRFPREVLDTY